MNPVSSLQELRALSGTDHRYEKLTVLASSLLGGREELDLHDHIEWLRIYAMATSEQEIVELVNDCIAQVDE
jgi:hypothetical protein